MANLSQSVLGVLHDTQAQSAGSFPFDRCVRGIITKKLTAGRYLVRVGDTKYTLTDNGAYTAGQSVWVMIPENDFNSMFILKAI